MKILLTGATGFVGGRVASALRRAGHDVIEVVRRPAPDRPEQIAGDFARDTDAAAWLPRLAGIDVVVNAVGIIRQSGTQSFSALHIQAPRALFAACVQAGVRKVVQISALGADDRAASRYHVSKASADRYLRSLPIASVVLRPSLVFGVGGASTRLLAAMASMPLVPLVGRGEQSVQPVHVDDLADLCVTVVRTSECDGRIIDVVGPQACTLRDLLTALRSTLGLGSPRFISAPYRLVSFGAAILRWVPGSLLDRETLAMLERGSTADPTGFAAALGRIPRLPLPLVADEGRVAWRVPLLAWSRMSWFVMLMRWSLALIWIVTGLLSFGIFPVAESLELLARLGLTGGAAKAALFGAAGLDILIGVAILLLRGAKWLWKLQFALVVGYTLAIAVALPEFLLHPFGPVLKNVPILAMIVILHEADA